MVLIGLEDVLTQLLLFLPSYKWCQEIGHKDNIFTTNSYSHTSIVKNSLLRKRPGFWEIHWRAYPHTRSSNFHKTLFTEKNQPWFSFESVTHKLESKKCKNVNFAIVMLGDCSSGEHGK